jgi:hypothetical protein
MVNILIFLALAFLVWLALFFSKDTARMKRQRREWEKKKREINFPID